jgi:hypothetical protein
MILRDVEYIGKKEVRLIFSTCLVIECELPTTAKAVSEARIIDSGMGLKFGPTVKDERSAYDLAFLGKVLFGKRPKKRF